MAEQHLEGFLDALRLTLRTYMTAQIHAVDPELEEILDEDFYLAGAPSPIPRYPALEFAAPDWTERGFSLGNIVVDLDFPIVFRIWAQHVAISGEEVLYRKLMRYTRALLNVCKAPDAFGSGVAIDNERGIRGGYRFNPETDEKEEVTGRAIVAFYLTGLEVLG